MSNIVKDLKIEELYKKELLLKKAELQLSMAKELYALGELSQSEYVTTLRKYDEAVAKFSI